MENSISYKEIADYTFFIDTVKASAEEIIEETNFYVEEDGMLIDDADYFAYRIEEKIRVMSQAVKCIHDFSKRYNGKVRSNGKKSRMTKTHHAQGRDTERFMKANLPHDKSIPRNMGGNRTDRPKRKGYQ